MPRNFATEIDALKRDLAQIKRGQRYAHGGSIENAALEVRDSTGTLRGRIGMQPDGTMGLIAQDGPAPGAPTAPVVTPSIGGLKVVWDGALADASPLPADFDHVAVHISTSTGFTPSAATFTGNITRSGDGGMLPVTPLPYDTHYVVLTAVNTSGIAGAASTETAATPLQVEGPDLTAGSVTAAHIQAGAVQADKLEAILQLVTRLVAGDPDGARVELNEDGLRVYNASGVLMVQFDAATGDAVFTGEVTGSAITGGTITGAIVQTDTTGERITLNEADANKILVYDATRPVAELSPFGLALVGSGGALMVLDPNDTYPNISLTNAGQTNSAVINVSEGNPGDANLGLNSGTFTASALEWKWRTFFGGDFWVAERVRDGATTTNVGGRISMFANSANIGYSDTTDATQDANLAFAAGLAQLTGGRLEILPVASAISAVYANAASGHTGNLLRLLLNGAEKFRVDKDGNTAADGVLTAGNIAVGRTTITPSAPNTPTSVNVTGLNLKGTNIRVLATPITTAPGTAVTGVGTTNATSTGFTLWLTRTNTVATLIDWMAFGV